MTDPIPGGPRVLTHQQLTNAVRSLHSVGGVYSRNEET